MRNTETALVFADCADVMAVLADMGKRMDWNILREYLSTFVNIQEMVIYLNSPPPTGKKLNKYVSRLRLKYSLESIGFLVKMHEVKLNWLDNKSSINVLLTIDALEMAQNIKPDWIVLLTGNGDLLPLVNELRYKGIKVAIACVTSYLNDDLKKCANEVICLSKVIEDLEDREELELSPSELLDSKTIEFTKNGFVEFAGEMLDDDNSKFVHALSEYGMFSPELMTHHMNQLDAFANLLGYNMKIVYDKKTS